MAQMRVISQDGTFDIPYNTCAFEAGGSDGGWVVAIPIPSGDHSDRFELARYSSKEYAVNALRLLREHFREDGRAYRFQNEEDLKWTCEHDHERLEVFG